MAIVARAFILISGAAIPQIRDVTAPHDIRRQLNREEAPPQDRADRLRSKINKQHHADIEEEAVGGIIWRLSA